MTLIRNAFWVFVVGVAVFGIGSSATLRPMPRAAAQAFFGPMLQGEVTQKFASPNHLSGNNTSVACCLIEVNGGPYNVSPEFFVSVQVGDIVRFDGVSWSIIRRFYDGGA